MLAAVLELIVPAGCHNPVRDGGCGNAWDGAGLFAAVTFDGVPENLALGVALIGAGYSEVGALAASIFLSNLPEAAGGAKRMREMGWRDSRVLGLWSGAALLLTAAAVAPGICFSATLLRKISHSSGPSRAVR